MVKWLRSTFSPAHHPDLVFWVCFFALNCLLFLPVYLLNLKTTSFLPLASSLDNDVPGVVRQLVLSRNNLDPFRLNVEISLLAALWVHVGWMRRSPHNRRFFRWLFLAIYFVALCYYVYESVMLYLYQASPAFYSHYQLMIDGIPFVLRHIKTPFILYVVATLALVAGVTIITRLIRTLIDGVAVEHLSRWSKIGLLLIALLVLVSALRYRDMLASPQVAISSLTYKLQKNLYDSIQVYHDVHAFDDTAPHLVYDYSGFELRERPDIYLLFVESYGSVLYKRQDYREAYSSLLSKLERQLGTEGWHAASTLSEAPVWGGGSWMSYTSTLFGLRIDTHPQFLSLLNSYQSSTYPDLGRYLKSQGYEYVRLSSLSDELDEEEWLKYQTFYGVDRWLRYSDLDFEGALYGWGPAPPDQYVLFYAHQAVASHTDKPTFLFFITQNSHYPWVPLPEVVDDWRTLNHRMADEQVPLSDPIPHEVKRSNYLNAVEYQLSFLTDFILKTGDENSIYILIGDHQPQQVSRHSDGFDTPVHVISKNAAFVDAFQDYGFVKGLAVHEVTPTIRHEGLYSMFVRVLLTQYGQDVGLLPEYRPAGITLEPSVSTDHS